MDHNDLVDALAAIPDDQIVKAVLDAAARRKLSTDQFAYVASDGSRHLPIADPAHVRAALARFNQTHFESDAKKELARRKIRAAAKRLGVEVADDDTAVSKAEASPAGVFVTITKADALEGIIYGKASVANLVDNQGDVIRPDVLRKAAHEFLANYNAFNDTHREDLPGRLVESWVEGNDWNIAFRPDDLEIARQAADGAYVGFSIEGEANRVKVQ